MIEKSELLQLLSVPLFGGIEPIELREALERRVADRDLRRRSLQTRQIFAHRGDPVEWLWLLLEGSLSAEMQNREGKVLRVEYLRSPSPVASPLLFCEDNSFPVTLVAKEESRLLGFSPRGILELTAEFPRLTQNLLREGGEKIQFLAEKLRLSQLSSLREKIAAHLMDLAERQGHPSAVKPRYTKTVLAEMLGVSRPALSRCFSLLMNEGYWQETSRGDLLLNPEKPLEGLLR